MYKIGSCMASCDRPTLHLERLAEPPQRLQTLGTRAHKCHELSGVCLWRRRYVLRGHSKANERALRLRVRMVHVGFEQRTLSETGLFRQLNSSDPPELLQPAWSECVPLVWWPLWGYNIAEFFLNSVTALDELTRAGVIDRRVILAPEVGGWPLRDWQQRLLNGLTDQPPVRTTGQLAPACAGGLARSRERCAARCYRRLLVCRFRDVYDHEPPTRPWQAAQSLVNPLLRSLRSGRKPMDAAADSAWLPGAGVPFTVLFVSRRESKHGARLLTNQGELLEACRRWVPPAACTAERVGPASCEARDFGRRGIAADVRAARRAHVLLGTHGAALTHGLFMREGSAIVEVRPYGFVGAWPDSYHLALARRENATRAFVVQTADPSLCEPRPAANVSAWDARPLNTIVRPAVLLRALNAAACAGGFARAPGGVKRREAALTAVPESPAAPFDYRRLQSPVLWNM